MSEVGLLSDVWCASSDPGTERAGDRTRDDARIIDLPGRAGRAGVGPRLDEGTERHLGPRRGLATVAGRPRPTDERVLRHVLDDLAQRVAAVAPRVLHLGAGLGERLALPRHRGRREVPVRVAGHAAGLEVRDLVAGRA